MQRREFVSHCVLAATGAVASGQSLIALDRQPMIWPVVEKVLGEERFALRCGNALTARLLAYSDCYHLRARISQLRKHLWDNWTVLPTIRIHSSFELPDDGYSIRVYGSEVVSGRLIGSFSAITGNNSDAFKEQTEVLLQQFEAVSGRYQEVWFSPTSESDMNERDEQLSRSKIWLTN